MREENNLLVKLLNHYQQLEQVIIQLRRKVNKMPDTVVNVGTQPAVVPVLSQAQIQAATQPIVDDAIQTEKEIASLVAAYKAHGVSGISALLPALYTTAQKDFKDVEVALPVVKEGWKTTEFWIVVGVILIEGYFTITGKETPFQTSEVLTVIGSAYALARGQAKKGNTATI